MNTRRLSATVVTASIMLVVAPDFASARMAAPVAGMKSQSRASTPVQVGPSEINGNGLTLRLFNVPSHKLNLPLPITPPAGGWTWPVTSATLIAGKKDAILVDTVSNVEDIQKLGDWVAASGKNLTAIYITHGHLDHFLGADALLKRFPKARLIATQDTIDLIKEEAASGKERATYTPLFADPIASAVVVPHAIPNNHFTLEGHQVIAVPTGQSDVPHASYLYVPDLSTALVGDIAYNGVNPTLVGSTHETRVKWIETLQGVQALKPKFVIAAHRDPSRLNNAIVLGETIAYIQDADRILAAHPTTTQFITQMQAAHPDRLNPTTLIFSAASLNLPQQ